MNKNNYVPLKNLCDIPTSLEVFFLCSNFFLLPNFVEILKISDPSRYNFTYKKSKRRQISLRCQAPILGIALMLFNCTLSSLLRDVLSVNGEGPWNGCAVQPFQSYSCSEHVSYCSLFLDSSLNPIFSCFSSFVSLSLVPPGDLVRLGGVLTEMALKHRSSTDLTIFATNL